MLLLVIWLAASLLFGAAWAIAGLLLGNHQPVDTRAGERLPAEALPVLALARGRD